MLRRATGLLLVIVAAIAVAGCGVENSEGAKASDSGPAALSDVELRNGIGPVSTVSLDEVDPALAATGEAIFTTKCSACHKFDTRYVGPPLGKVLDERTPEYVMNMMLNPEEMIQRHPDARAMLGQYMTQMPSQNLTMDDARALLEYIRTQQE